MVMSRLVATLFFFLAVFVGLIEMYHCGSGEFQNEMARIHAETFCPGRVGQF